MPSNERNVFLSPHGLTAIQTKALKLAEHKTLWWLVANLPIGGGIVTLSDVQNGCAIKHSNNASVYLQTLVKEGFIRRMSKIERSYFYRLNPNWFKVSDQ